MSLLHPAKLTLLLVLASTSFLGRAEAQKSTCVPIPEGMVGWWPSDIGVRDRLGGHNGEAGDGLSYTAGKVGNAFAFYTADSFVKVPPISDLATAPGLTIECWICPQTTSIYPIVEWNDGQGHLGAHLWVFDGVGKLFFNLISQSGESHGITSGPGIIKKGEFQHIAATYDKEGGIARLYRNGVLMAEDYLGKFQPATNYVMYFGCRPQNENHFRGEMDEVGLFNRALTGNEVKAIYDAGSAGFCLPDDNKVTAP